MAAITAAARPRQAAIALVLLSLMSLLNFYDRLLVAVVSQPLRDSFRLSDSQYGLLSGPAFVVLYAAGNLVCGWLADRYRRTRVLAAALALWSAMTALSALAGSFAMLALGRAGMGVGEGASGPAGLSLLSDHYPPVRRTLPIAVFVGGGMLGICLSFVLGSWIATQYSWRMVFLVAGIPGLLLAALIATVMVEPPRGRFDRPATERLSYRQALGQLRANAAFVWICLASAMGTFNSLGMLVWLPQFFIRSHGLSTREVGLLFGPVAALGLTVGVLLGGLLGARLARHSLHRPLLLCMGVCALMIPLYLQVLWTPSVTVALAVTFVAMTSTAAYSGVVQAAMQNVATPQARATAAGLFATVVALIGQGVLPYAVGLLSDALRPALHESSLRWSITVMACLYSAAATVLFLLAWRATRAHFARAALEDPGALALARAADAEPAR